MRYLSLGILALALLACARETAPAAAWNAAAGTIEVRGVRHPRRATLTVHTGPPDAPAMLGRVEVRDDALAFHPRFPLVPGLAYRVRVNGVESTVAIPKRATAPTTHVAQVFPTADALPANQLKFYLDFSAPMSTGDAYRYIHLLDDAGNEVPRAFLVTAHELWDAKRTRFTLILDPGRIKRGLRANVESGSPLREGSRYSLVIDREWPDGDRNPLRERFSKSFGVTASDRTMPDRRQWRVIAPATGTTDPLRVQFDEPLDRAMLEDSLLVRDVAGDITISSSESEWLFRPREPWRVGAYVVQVDPRLEDRAGNNLRRLFDEEVLATRDAVDAIELPFAITRRTRP